MANIRQIQDSKALPAQKNTYDDRRPGKVNLVNDQNVDVESLRIDITRKLDLRNLVDHTFITAGEEQFSHNLNRVPRGYVVGNQTATGIITGDKTKWTDRKVFLTSSVAPNTVTFLFY